MKHSKKYVKASSGLDVEIGDQIRIEYMDGEPQYTGKVGTVTDIQVDPWGDTAIYGTWGGCSLYPAAGDSYTVLRKGAVNASRSIKCSVDTGSDDLLDEAYNGSWFTVEGAGGDLKEWEDGLTQMLQEAGIGVPSRFVTFTGKQVSDHFGFEGHNRYPDDLTLLCFPLDGLNTGKLAMFKLRFGARWFDDIVDNAVNR